MRTINALLCVLAGFLAAGGAAYAQTAPEHRHEISVGWGDQMFETLAWHVKSQPIGLLPESTLTTYSGNYRYSQHWFGEYRYNTGRVFSVGAMADWSGVWWDDITINGNGVEKGRNRDRCFQNICVMPVLRFTYMRTKYVNMHSGFGAGVDINTGTETDYLGRKTEIGPAVYLKLLGVTGHCDRYFATVDFGGIFSLHDPKMLFLLGSRLVSVSVGVSF